MILKIRNSHSISVDLLPRQEKELCTVCVMQHSAKLFKIFVLRDISVICSENFQ